MAQAHERVEREPLPWFAGLYKRLDADRAAGRLAHALLLNAPAGIGLVRFARTLAGVLLCRQPDAGLRCGRCHACELFAAGNHPDYRELGPEGAGARIRIDAVRDLAGFSQTTAQQGGYRVALLHPAEALNLHAANALLKTLEEPGGDTLLILVSHALATVAPTIRSRCQIATLPLPPRDQALAWLAQTGADSEAVARALDAAFGAPLLAERYLRDSTENALHGTLLRALGGELPATAAAADCAGDDLLAVVDTLYRLLARRCRQLSPGDARLRDALALLDRIIAARIQLLRGANPNGQLLLEGLLTDGCRVFA